MKKIKASLTILATISLVVFNLLILAPNSYAGDFLDPGNQEGMEEIAAEYGQSTEDPTDIRIIIIEIVRIVLGLLAIIFVILLIHAGFRYMTAQGNDTQVAEAKKQIINGLIGLAIILAALGITTFVLQALHDAARGGAYMS